MKRCPTCGSVRFCVSGPITIWQTLEITNLDEEGKYTELDNQLHDTIATHAFEAACCAECAEPIPLRLLLS